MTDYVRCQSAEGNIWGLIDGNEVFKVEGSLYGKWSRGRSLGPMSSLKLLAPCEPKLVVGLAYNYKDLVGERDVYEEPLSFIKSPACVISASDQILMPKGVKKVWIETELAIVLKTALFNATNAEAEASILGYVIANDVTAENIHGRDHHLARSKSLPSFCPVGNILKGSIDTGDLKITTSINGRYTQRGSTKDRIYNDIETLVLLSTFMPLSPGDLILTGTPAGAMDSIVQAGDSIEMSIENVGSLHNQIISR